MMLLADKIKTCPLVLATLMIKRFGFIQQEAQVSQKGLFTLDRYGRAFKNYAKKPFHQRISGKGSLFSLMWLIKSSQGTAILGMLDKCGLSQKYLRSIPGGQID